MSMNNVVTGLKAKTFPLYWWKLVMTLKALAAPAIGAIAYWIFLDAYPASPISLGNRVDQITTVVVSLVTTVIAGLSAYAWQKRGEDRIVWSLSVLLSFATGGMASGIVFELMHASTYVY